MSDAYIVVYATPRCGFCQALQRQLAKAEREWSTLRQTRVLLQNIEPNREQAKQFLTSVPTLRLFRGQNPRFVREAVGPADPLGTITQWLSDEGL